MVDMRCQSYWCEEKKAERKMKKFIEGWKREILRKSTETYKRTMIEKELKQISQIKGLNHTVLNGFILLGVSNLQEYQEGGLREEAGLSSRTDVLTFKLNVEDDRENATIVKQFIIVGFSASKKIQSFLFLLFLLVYASTVAGNGFMIIIICKDHHLHTPMYFFLSNFSFLEICFTSVTVPKMLSDFMVDSKTISFSGCITQLFFYLMLGCAEIYFLAAMAYDRYLAICNPLRYPLIMNNPRCVQLSILCWTGGFISALAPTILVSRLSFCSSNVINHYFCDVTPLMKLSCTDTRTVEIIIFVQASTVAAISLLFTLASYICIISSVLRIPTSTNRWKAFSTCGSHLTVVTIFFGTGIFMYTKPAESYSLDDDKVVSVFYSVITPLLNPFIYSLRNKDVKDALRKAMIKNKSLVFK
ncbi:olfactory receptor 5A1-like [Rhinatrema bivittatum]|uniref:olfactory receptor 5A1-like n=1 Tax=Rhinatrema bivittatum TaxID=194408 RepID=UPI001126957F|nr:olfactory receptor 5A1-like [Rhinatrema bivittatum]